MVSCSGLYADIVHTEDDVLTDPNSNLATEPKSGQDKEDLLLLLEGYRKYKTSYARNIHFDPNSDNLSIHNTTKANEKFTYFISAATIEYAPLQLVQIYFDTATYDKVERDVKVTLEAQLGLIGGTMGLLTGFSILSGVEIIYYVIKLIVSLKTSRTSE